MTFMAGQGPKSRVLIYRNLLLPISETFVYNQTMLLSRYEAFFLGSKRCQGHSITLPEERMYLVNQGGRRGWLREFRFKVGGWVPPDVLMWAKAIRPRLVHAHFGPDGVVAIPLARQLGVPLIVSFHGTDATMKVAYVWRHSYITHRLYWLKRKRLSRVASRIIVQSNFLRDRVITAHGMPEDKIVCIRHGVDLTQFTPRQDEAERGHVLYVGRLIELKGLNFLLAALVWLRASFPDLHLTVVGDGPMRARYETMARELLGMRVRFVGAQPQSVVHEYLRKAWVFCMPSVTMPSGEAESLGMVFLEAMAMKVPVVSFASGGIPEVILHGKTGFLARERDVDELAHYLKLLLESEELRRRMGEAGRKWVAQEFDLAKQNAKLEALYDEVIAEHDRRGKSSS